MLFTIVVAATGARRNIGALDISSDTKLLKGLRYLSKCGPEL